MSILEFLQNNSFIIGLVITLGLSGIMTYVKFRSMGEKIHLLHKRLASIEDEKITKIESKLNEQAVTIGVIDERTKSIQITATRIESRLINGHE